MSLLLVFSYLLYGRDINTLYVTDLGNQGQNIIERFTQRANPQVRILVIAGNQKYYSDIVRLDQKGLEYKLQLTPAISSFKIDSLQVLDARINIASKLVVVGQVLEEFDKPKESDAGIRFAYRIERRWHF